MRRPFFCSTVAPKQPLRNRRIGKPFDLKSATYSEAGRKSLGAKSFRSRRQVSHSCGVPGRHVLLTLKFVAACESFFLLATRHSRPFWLRPKAALGSCHAAAPLNLAQTGAGKCELYSLISKIGHFSLQHIEKT